MAAWHPWHSVSIGPKAPSLVTAIIEIPKGSKNKYEIAKESGLLCLDRVLSSPMVYPVNYGFIPQTYCEDGDALDIMVLGQEPVPPLCLLNARVIGVLKMIDGGDSDDKVLAVHNDDPQFKHLRELDDVQAGNPHLLLEIEQFFKTYKLLEKKHVEIIGWSGREAGEDSVVKAIQLYNAKKESLIV